MIEVTDDWTAVDWERPPAVPGAGPFPRRGFLETWWRHRGAGRLCLVESETALLPLRVDGGLVEFLGEPDLTDYHSPLGSGAGAAAAAFLDTLPPGTRFRFDSLPVEAAAEMAAGLEEAGLTPTVVDHEVSAVLALADTVERHRAALSPKQRHETRRKSRRFADAFGPARLVSSWEGFGVFVAMHRAAAGPKGGFMTSEVEGFFADLGRLPETVLHLLCGDEGAPVAAAFGFQTGDAYYLYNSAFDPAAAFASPGIVLLEALVEDAIGAGRSTFDLLKGDEEYKFRMGATRRVLQVVEGVT